MAHKDGAKHHEAREGHTGGSKRKDHHASHHGHKSFGKSGGGHGGVHTGLISSPMSPKMLGHKGGSKLMSHAK